MQFGWSNVNGMWIYFNKYDGNQLWTSNYSHGVWERVHGYSSPSPYLVAIDNDACRVVIFERNKDDWAPIQDWTAGPGKPSTPTVRGVYSVGSRGFSFGHGYTCYYWTQFFNDYLFHSVLYNPGTYSIQDGTLGRQVSLGCVRLDIDNAKWIYYNIPSGTTVISY